MLRINVQNAYHIQNIIETQVVVGILVYMHMLRLGIQGSLFFYRSMLLFGSFCDGHYSVNQNLTNIFTRYLNQIPKARFVKQSILLIVLFNLGVPSMVEQ